MTWVVYALLAMIFILCCYLLFEIGRIYENTIMIREIEEKIDDTTRKIKRLEAAIKKIETKE